MTTRITIWYKLDDDGVWDFNHISDGWSIEKKPEPKSKYQKQFWTGWGQYWQHQLGWLDDGKVVTTGAANYL